MLKDVKSNHLIAEHIVSQLATPAAINGTQVDHSLANSASFFINVGAITGTVDAKLQHSPDGTTWTDDDGASGNGTAITQITATGSAQLDIVAPQDRYSRVVATVGGTTAQIAVVSIAGPLRSIYPTDAS